MFFNILNLVLPKKRFCILSCFLSCRMTVNHLLIGLIGAIECIISKSNLQGGTKVFTFEDVWHF